MPRLSDHIWLADEIADSDVANISDYQGGSRIQCWVQDFGLGGQGPIATGTFRSQGLLPEQVS